MSILCRILGHKASAEPVWNEGFYFSRCSRCSADLVRIPGEPWHIPRKAQVVWRTTRPELPPGPSSSGGKDQFQPMKNVGTNKAQCRAGEEPKHEASLIDAAPLAPKTIPQNQSAIPDFMSAPEGDPEPETSDAHRTGASDLVSGAGGG